MALATLSIDLEARLAGLQEGFDKAAAVARKNAEATAAAWNQAGSVVAGIGATVAGAFAGFSVVEWVKANAAALDALNDVADATGSSIENISALEDLAMRTGTTLDVVTTSLVKLNASLNEAKPNSPAALALKGIGLEATKLKQLDPSEALRQVAVALSGYADDGNKARLVQELFGKSLREVAPFLNDLAEKTELTAKVTTEQAKQAEAFNKQLFELQTHSAETARAIASQLLPALNQLFGAVKGKESGGDYELMEALVVPLQAVSVLGANVAYVFKGIGAEIGGLAAQASALARGDFSGFATIHREMVGDAQRAREEFDKLEQRLMSIGKVRQAERALTQSEREAEAKRADKATYEKNSVRRRDADANVAKADEISEAQRALAAYVAELRREFEQTTALTEQQKALNVLKGLGTMGQVPEVRELVLGLERQVTLAKQDTAIRADNLRLAKEREAVERSIAEEIYKLSGRADEARKIALTTALEDQLNSGIEYSAQELERIVKGIAGLTDDAKDKFEELDEMTKQWARNTQDALGDTVLSTLKGDFSNILSLWGNLLLKMGSQAIAADLGKSLFGNFFANKGDGAGQLGGLFGDAWKYFSNTQMATGGVLDSGGIRQFAAGDIFSQTTRFTYGGGRSVGELGEAGPEAIMPLRRGRDGRLGVVSAGGGGDTYHFNIASGVTRAELASMVPQLVEQAKAAVIRSSRRPGGAF